MADLTCSNCGQQAPADAQFCIFCGTSLFATSSPEEEAVTPASEPDEAASFDQEIRQVRRELQGAGQLLNQLMDRVQALERARLEQAGQTPRLEPTSPSSPQATPIGAMAGVADRAGAAGATSTPHRPPPSAPGTAWEGRPPLFPPFFRGLSIDWENVLGRNWFAIVGAIALTVGVGFFLKLSFDNQWIGETGRIILGIAVGLALLGAGEFAERRYPLWAQPVTAGGIAVLYLSIYAGFALYDLTSGLSFSGCFSTSSSWT